MELDTELTIRWDGGAVVMEPGSVAGVQGVLFSVSMTPERAREIGHQLISAAASGLPPTCKTGFCDGLAGL